MALSNDCRHYKTALATANQGKQVMYIVAVTVAIVLTVVMTNIAILV